MEFAHRRTDGPDDWDGWEAENVAVVDGKVRIATAPFPRYRSSDRIDRPAAAPDGFIDVAVDACGVVFLLGANGGIYRHGPDGREGIVRVDCAAGSLADPRAIGVTRDTILVADGDPARVIAYARHAPGLRWRREAGIHDPVGLVRIDGDVAVLDRGPEPGSGTLGRLRPDGTYTVLISDLVDPIDATVDADGNVWILEPHRWRGRGGHLLRSIPAPALTHPPVPAVGTVRIPPSGFRTVGTGASFTPTSLAVGASNEVLVGAERPDRDEGALLGYRPVEAGFDHHLEVPVGCVALAMDPSVARAGSNSPPRSYLIDAVGDLHVATGKRTHLRGGSAADHRGRLSRRFDSGARDTQWHRIRLRSERPSRNTHLTLRYAATNVAEPERLSVDPAELPTDLTTVSGIGPRKAWRLRRSGITDLRGLAESDPGTIAAILGVEEIVVETGTVRDWQDQAESLRADGTESLRAVDGIGPTFADRLMAVGIGSLAELVATDAERIASLLGSRLRTVSTERTARWIADAAARLPEPPDTSELTWRSVPDDPEEVFPPEAVGRYLWIELTLEGTADETPALAAVDVTDPRRSHLDDLPAIYRTDREASGFLEPFLGLFESVLSEVDGSIADLPTRFDPSGTPSDGLDWLATWVAAEVDPTWPDPVKRAYLSRAPELHRLRGTRRGLEAAVDCYLEHVDLDLDDWTDRAAETPGMEPPVPVRVFEAPEIECAAGTDAYGPYKRLLSCPQGFAVLIHPAVPEKHVRAIGRIVGTQRPAHTSGRAVALRPLTVLTGEEGARGFHSYLGINTLLPRRTFTADSSTLGQETVLSEREPYAAAGVRSRLDEDLRLS